MAHVSNLSSVPGGGRIPHQKTATPLSTVGRPVSPPQTRALNESLRGMNLDLPRLESQLSSATDVSGFANVVNGMKEDDFDDLSQELIQQTAYRLYTDLIQNDSDRQKLLDSFFLKVLNPESLANVKTNLELLTKGIALEGADLDSFKTALDGMTEDEFNPLKNLIQSKTLTLFRENGGEITPVVQKDGTTAQRLTPNPEQPITFALEYLAANIDQPTVRDTFNRMVQLLSVTLDTFEDAVADMTEEQFKVSQALIQNTAKRLFREEGGTFAKYGEWEIDTKTQEALFNLHNSKDRTEFGSNVEALKEAKLSDQRMDEYRRQLSQTLETATLATFKDAVDGMTKEQFFKNRDLIQETAQRLFRSDAVGGSIEGNTWTAKEGNQIQSLLNEVCNSTDYDVCKKLLVTLNSLHNIETSLSDMMTDW